MQPFAPSPGTPEFVTGQIARIDLATATATIINAGHPSPLRLREGHAEAVSLRPDLPFGTARDPAYTVRQLLRPGDRLVFLTDGMLDRNASAVDIEATLIAGAKMHPREAVQDLVRPGEGWGPSPLGCSVDPSGRAAARSARDGVARDPVHPDARLTPRQPAGEPCDLAGQRSRGPAGAQRGARRRRGCDGAKC